MTDVSGDRLVRIENKLDQLADAVVQLARMEERMISLFNRMDEYDKKMGKITDRVDKVETDTTRNRSALAFAERIFWVLFTAAVSTGLWIAKT